MSYSLVLAEAALAAKTLTHTHANTHTCLPLDLLLDFLLLRHFHGRTSLYKKFFLLPRALISSMLVFLFKLPLLAPAGVSRFESLWERILVAAKAAPGEESVTECAMSQTMCEEAELAS